MTKSQTTSASETAVPPAIASEPIMRPAVKPIIGSKVSVAEFVVRRHAATLDRNIPIEATLEPRFWCNVAANFRQGDTIELHWPDAAAFALLYVRSSSGGPGGSGLMLAPLSHVVFDQAVEKATPVITHISKFLGPNESWGVQDIRSGKTVAANLPDREAADQFVKNLRS